MAKNVQLTIDIKGNDTVSQASEKTKKLRDDIQKLKETLASGGLGEKEYEKATEKLQKYEDRLNKFTNKTTSLQSELRKLTNEIASGKLSGKDLILATERAGALKDQIADAKQEVNNLSSDTRKLDAFLQLGQGIAGGFAAAQGAMALFGSENEDLQKSLVKIQSSVAVLNGVQAVANSLNKSSALMTELQTVKLKVLTFVETQRAAAVEAGGNAMQRAAVKARFFGIALGALGIGALIAGVIYLITNFDKLTAAFDRTTMSQKALKETQEAYSNGAKDAQVEVNKMASTFNLAKKGLVDKQKALIEYNEKFGKTLGIAKDYNEAEKLFAEKSAAYVKAMALRAQANALYEKSAESTVKQIDALNEDNISNTDKLLLGIKTSIFGVRNTIDDITKAQAKGTDEIVNQEKKKQIAYQNTADSLMQMSLELENQNKIDLSGVENKQEKKVTKTPEELEKDKQEALKRAKEAIKQQIKNFDEENEAIKKDKQTKLEIEEEYQDALLEKQIKADNERRDQIKKDEEERLALIEEYKAMEAQTEIDLQDAKIQAVQTGAQILGQLAGQNKALAISALAIEKGAAIAGVIINASRELSANALTASLNPLNSVTGGAAGAAQLLKLNALTKIRAGINIASIGAAGISGAKNIASSGGGGGSVQPPNIRGSQTSNEQPTPQPTKVFVTEVDIRSSLRKVDGIYTQSTII
jgi:hypothetical protein